jgi:hypothetical protein
VAEERIHQVWGSCVFGHTWIIEGTRGFPVGFSRSVGVPRTRSRRSPTRGPVKPGANFSNCPYIIVTLIGELKEELGTKHHLIALASWRTSGIELRWWLEELLKVQEEGCKRGPAVGHKDGSVALMSEYDNLLHFFLGKVQDKNPELILHSDDIEGNYSFLQTFRRTAVGNARGAQLDSSVQNAMNRWRKIEEAKGKHPRFNMVDHYSHARQLMLVMWQYLFVQ